MPDFKEAGAKPAKRDWYMTRMIGGSGGSKDEAVRRYNYIPSGGMNKVIEDWHAKQPTDRGIEGATPSQITICPRVLWLKMHKVPTLNDMTWATRQRLLLGRVFEDKFAEQLTDAGLLLHHWQDNPDDKVDRFAMGEGLEAMTGVPDYLLQLNGQTVISDAKTSRSDAFGYLPTNELELWTDGGYYKYKMQLTAYYMLCLANQSWFEDHNLPLPSAAHLFAYALDDGLVRREVTWTPSQADQEEVMKYVRRFNAVTAEGECPPCTCTETLDGFEVKFCDYGILADGKKICEECCSDNLIPVKGV